MQVFRFLSFSNYGDMLHQTCENKVNQALFFWGKINLAQNLIKNIHWKCFFYFTTCGSCNVNPDHSHMKIWKLNVANDFELNDRRKVYNNETWIQALVGEKKLYKDTGDRQSKASYVPSLVQIFKWSEI